MEDLSVMIVGAGLAGLALAVGLHERRIPFLLFEKGSTLRNTASTVFGIFKNGSTALDGVRPGLSSLFRSVGTDIDLTTMIAYRGETPTIHHSPPNVLYMIAWAEAQRLLASLIPSERIIFGHKLISYEAVKGGVKATFEVNKDSASTRTICTKLLIGADGIWSNVRKTLVGDLPRYTHQMYWNALVGNLNETFKNHGPGKLVMIRDEPFTTRAVTINSAIGNLFWNLRTLDADGELSRQADASAHANDILCHKTRALKVVNDLGGLGDLRKAIQDTEPEKISERKIMDHVPLTSWSGADGHVLLIGDAAHAMHYGPGQGAMTSFEDAHQLSNLLEATFGSSNTLTVAEAVFQFEKMRIPRLNKIQNFSAEASGYKDLIPTWTTKLSEEEKMKRTMEYMKWVHAYPEKMSGDPDSDYWR